MKESERKDKDMERKERARKEKGGKLLDKCWLIDSGDPKLLDSQLGKFVKM